MSRFGWSCALVLVTLSVAAAPVEIREWEVPYRMVDGETVDGLPEEAAERTRPRDPYLDGKGRVWFCGQAGNYLAYLEPGTGAFVRYRLDPGTHPHNLIVDRQDRVWYAGNRAAHIGRLDPETGAITKYPMPDPSVRDPHTLIWDAAGDIWFTAQGANVVGKLSVTGGEVQVVPVAADNARPYGIVMDSSDRPWIALFGKNALAVVTGAALVEHPLPAANARPRRLAITSDDRVWFVDYPRGYLGRLDPASGEVSEWLAPGGERALPYAMAADDRDRLWFVESPNAKSRLVGFDPTTEEFFSVTPLKSGGLTARHMIFHAPSRTLWFGTDANTIVRARVP